MGEKTSLNFVGTKCIVLKQRHSDANLYTGQDAGTIEIPRRNVCYQFGPGDVMTLFGLPVAIGHDKYHEY